MSLLPDGPGWGIWPAPAKLNLFLRVTGRRADGMHTLQTVFQLLEWGDRIALRLRDDGAIARHGSAAGLPDADADLTVRAARLLQRHAGHGGGLDIAIDKQVPIGGGFGGGSSDAATVLVVANLLWGCGLGTAELAALGATLGADVPVFVHGDNAWAEGVGDQLQPVVLPAAWYLIVAPAFHADTASLFAAPELTRNAAAVTMADFVSGVPLGNAFAPLLRERVPAVAVAWQALSQAGPVQLTGSGSGLFVAFDDAQAAQAAWAALPSALGARLVRGARRSPLLRALAGAAGG